MNNLKSGPVAFSEGLYRKRFLILFSFITVIVFAGFWPYFSPLLQFTPIETHWIIHVHAAVFVGWLVILLMQARFVYLGKMKSHIKVGAVGIKYGLAVFALGLIVAFAGPILSVNSGQRTLEQAAGFFLLPLGSILLFGGLFFSAVFFRKKNSEIHKRLILLSTVALIFPPSARLFSPVAEPFAFLALWLSPVFLAILIEGLHNKRIEPVYLIGLAILLLGYSRVFFMESDAWLSIGRPMLNLFIP